MLLTDEQIGERLVILSEHWERPVEHVRRVLLTLAIASEDRLEVCRDCGCTEYDPCVAEDGETCAWAGPELCTFCAERNANRH